MTSTQLGNALALVQEELKDAVAKIDALEEKLAAAEAKAEKYEKLIMKFKEGIGEMEKEEKMGAATDWRVKLEEYVARHKK